MAIEKQKGDNFLRGLLRRIIEAEDFPGTPNVSIRAGSEAGDGYVGIYNPIEVESDGNVLKLFAKSATQNETERSQIYTEGLFGREILFYNTIFPEFLKFQQDRNLKQPFNNVPRCYLTSTENLHETLIFENLKEQSYVVYDKTVEMNDEHFLFVLKLYARFHAVSYAMQDQAPETYAKITENAKDFFWKVFKSMGFDEVLAYHCEEAQKLFDSPEDSRVAQRIQNLNETLLHVASKSDEYLDEYSVVTHGDCWCNNFLFKYTDQNTLEDVKFLDWQIMRVNSPVLDLSYFFYSTATENALPKLDFYLKSYHDTLQESIKEMGSDPEKLFPYTVFRQHWKKFSRFGLAVGLYMQKMTLTEKQEAPKVREIINAGGTFAAGFANKIEKDDVYKRRIRHIIEHFVHNDYI